MKLFIASDHAGFHLKDAVKAFDLEDLEFVDLGCKSQDSVDYPSYAQDLAKEVLGSQTKGILICGSGIGMSIAANRFPGIRAALCFNEEFAKLSRQHNDSNVLVLPARFITQEQAKLIIEVWLNTDFEAGRHEKRVKLIDS